MKLVFLSFLLSISTLFFGQEIIQGKIIDAENNEGLAFVSIVFGNTSAGFSTDIDGNFEFISHESRKTIQLSYIGYLTIRVTVAEYKSNNYIIKLQKSSTAISEVTILPGVNPAHRLIKNAIKNRKINNPELATEFFYESYNKMSVTVPLDSNSKSKLDSLTLNNVALKDKIDNIPVSKTAFVMESVAERNHFPPDFSNEIVTQSRMSGIKTPFFSMMGTQLQSFSLYKDFITLYGINYFSPVSIGSTNKYLFVIEDTIFKGNDTSFIISFQPKKNKYFQGLKGVLAINSNLYAVENFSAKQNDSTGFPIEIQQHYEFVGNKQWFPTQLHINITLKTDVGNAVTFVAKGRSYFRNIELKAKIDRNEIENIVIRTDPNIEAKNEAFWKTVREVPLNKNENLTYQFMDSIGEAENLDRLVFITRGLLRGFVPIGPFNLTLNKILKFNQYENMRLGLGVETNDKVIKNINLGGFAGYGFKDKALKYGSHLKWNPISDRQFRIKFEYSNDIIGIGNTQFNNEVASFTATSNVQNFINDQYDGIEKYEATVSFRALRDFHFTLFGNQQKRTFNSDYNFFSKEGLILNATNFNLTEAGIDFRYSYKEKFGEMLGVILPVETKYPIFYFKYTKGFNRLLNGQFDYNRIDLSFYKSAPIKNLGRISIQLNAGVIDEVIPLTSLYGMRGIFDPSINVASSFSFETMFPNEFYADRYFNFFYRHNFGSLIFKSPKFKPQLLLVTSYSIGTLKNQNRHQNFDFKTLEHGYSESGIQFNNLVRIKYFYDGIYFGLGAGAYYRYGAYANPHFKDNVALKITTTFGM